MMPPSRRNISLLLLILLLDLIGFSLIFPLVPDLLEFYLKGAKGHALDQWLLPITDFFRSVLPEERQSEPELIILMGGVLASIYSFLQFLCSLPCLITPLVLLQRDDLDQEDFYLV